MDRNNASGRKDENSDEAFLKGGPSPPTISKDDERAVRDSLFSLLFEMHRLGTLREIDYQDIIDTVQGLEFRKIFVLSKILKQCESQAAKVDSHLSNTEDDDNYDGFRTNVHFVYCLAMFAAAIVAFVLQDDLCNISWSLLIALVAAFLQIIIAFWSDVKCCRERIFCKSKADASSLMNALIIFTADMLIQTVFNCALLVSVFAEANDKNKHLTRMDGG